MQPRPLSHRRSTQRGFGLLEASLLLLLVGGALVAGLLALRSHQASVAAEQEMAALTQADRYILGFVAGHNRLPCPDTDSDGYENCDDSTQKGRLPYRTLGLEGSMAEAGTGLLAYEVQISAANLTKAIGENNLFEPVDWDDPNYTGHRSLNTHGTADFCQALTNAAAATPLATHARVGDAPTGTGYPVAYALAHPGRVEAGAGAGGVVFDGLNASSSVAMELPEKGGLLGSYDDRVVARTYQGLAQSLDCDRWRTALNTVSLGVLVVEEVASQRESITLSAGILTTISGVKAIVFGIKTALSAENLATASGYMGSASGILAAAIASCAVLVGCFEIPHAAASVAAAAVAIGASVAGIALNVTAIVSSVVAFGLTTAAAVAAGNQPSGTTVDVGSAITGAKSSWDGAIATTAKAQTAYDSASTQLLAADTDRKARFQALLDASHALVRYTNNLGSPTHGTLPEDMLDSEFTTVRDKADAWKLAEQNQRSAESDLDQATKAAANSNSTSSAGTQAQITKLTSQRDAETDPAKKAELQAAIDRLNEPLDTGNNAAQATKLQAQIADITAQIDDLDTQIAATPVGTDGRDDLVLRHDALVDQRTSVNQQLTNISMTVAVAQANLTAAKAATTTAKTALTTAYQHAIDQFKPAAQRLKYTVCSQQLIVPTPSKPPLTHEVCDANYVDGLNTYIGADGPDSITPKIYGLFNIDLSPYSCSFLSLPGCPSWIPFGVQTAGVYYNYWDLTVRKANAQAQLTQAQTKQADAKRSYDTLVALSTSSAGGAGTNAVWPSPLDILTLIEKTGAIR